MSSANHIKGWGRGHWYGRQICIQSILGRVEFCTDSSTQEDKVHATITGQGARNHLRTRCTQPSPDKGHATITGQGACNHHRTRCTQPSPDKRHATISGQGARNHHRTRGTQPSPDKVHATITGQGARNHLRTRCTHTSPDKVHATPSPHQRETWEFRCKCPSAEVYTVPQ